MKIMDLINKSITTLLLAFILVSILASCGTGLGASGNSGDNINDNNGNTGNDGQDNEPDKAVNDDAVWGNGIYLRVVKADGSPLDVASIIAGISVLTDTPAVPATDVIPSAEHEFIIGEADRALSREAYSVLDERLSNDFAEGWLLYVKGNSMALAFSSENSMKMAFEYVDNVLLKNEELVFENDGVATEHIYDSREYAAEQLAIVREAAFERIEKSLGKATSDALRELYSLYSSEVYDWIARLYDPETGGFYFSNSGRDNDGFLPDIESTVQALNHLTTAGMFVDNGGSYARALPDKMKEELLAFAKGLQSSDDGYFYHPQWGDSVIVARRGRDLGWATQLIQNLGGRPYWNTPGGVSGEYGPPGLASSAALTRKLSCPSAAAVSSVRASSSYLPEYLRSLDAWKEYIDGLNIYDDPYTSGNTLAAQHNEIKNAGKEYIDHLINYLNGLQDEKTGFWGEGVTYVTMNGFMKLSSSYAYYGKAVPNVEAALHSTIEILLTPDTPERDLHICNTYNTWVNFTQILSSAKKTDGEAKVNELREIIRSKAPELIKMTYEKVKTHKRSEGGFSYFETKTCNASQKAPVACALVPESDVNATAISVTGIVSNMFGALGVDKVPVYCGADFDVFLEILETKEPIVKNEEKFDFPELSGERGQGLYFEQSNKYGGIAAPAVSGGTSKAKTSDTEDKYVYFYKNIGEGQTNKQDSVNFELPTSRPADAVGIAFELDIAFGNFGSYTDKSGVAGMQINLYDAEELASVYFGSVDGKIKLLYSEITDGEDLSLDEGKWYNLRFESLPYGDTRAVRIYVNGEYACTAVSADDKSATAVRATITLRQYDTNDWIAFDNVYAGYLKQTDN